nr:diguanylate cyclase [uncultured Caproiciproducens sp.]
MKIKPKLGNILILAVSCSILTATFSVFTYQINHNIRTSINHDIAENEERNSAAITAKFNEKFSVLNSLSSFIGSRDIQNNNTAMDVLHSFSENSPFAQICIADLNGDCITDTGLKSNVAEYDFFKESLNGDHVVCDSYASSLYGKESVLFSVPVYRNKAIAGVLLGISDTGQIQSALNAPLYDGTGSRLLINRDGSVVLQSDTPFYSTDENFFSFLQHMNHENKNEIDDIRSIISHSVSGMVDFKSGSTYHYLYFTPVGNTDWYLMTIVPTDVVLSRFKYLLLMAGLLVLGTALTFILLGIYAVILLRRKNSDLKKGTQELKALTANIPGCVQRCKYDSFLTMVYCSDGFLQLTGYTLEEIDRSFHNQFIKMIYEPDREVIKRSINIQLQAGSVIDIQYRLRKKDGSLVWILDKGQLMVESSMEPELYCLLIDITDQREIIQELEISNERYKIVLDQSDSMIFEYDILNSTVSHSTNSLPMFGSNQAIQDFPNSVLKSQIIHPDDIGMFELMFSSVKSGAHSAEGECRLKNEKGSYLWYNIKITTIFNKDGNPIRAIGRISDVTCQKEATQQLMQKAQRDGLTGLLNKSATKVSIEQALSGNELCALYIIDVDHFKEINDNLGHMFGDSVLAGIGDKLKRLFRASDVVGRIGGDEFMVLLKNISNLSLVAEKADALHQSLMQTFGNDLKHYSISGSIGIAIYPKDGLTYSDLYKKADAALYEAKRCGRNQYVVFDNSIEALRHMNASPEFRNTLTPTLKSTAMIHKSFQDDMLSYVFDMLYHANDIESVIGIVLKISGERFHVSHAYIYENAPDHSCAVNTNEWCAENTDCLCGRLKYIANQDMNGYVDLFNEDGILFCNDISQLENPMLDLLKAQGIHSILHLAIFKDECFKGLVGFDDCDQNRIWTLEEIDALSSITKIISIFLLIRHSGDNGNPNNKWKSAADK